MKEDRQVFLQARSYKRPLPLRWVEKNSSHPQLAAEGLGHFAHRDEVRVAALRERLVETCPRYPGSAGHLGHAPGARREAQGMNEIRLVPGVESLLQKLADIRSVAFAMSVASLDLSPPVSRSTTRPSRIEKGRGVIY